MAWTLPSIGDDDIEIIVLYCRVKHPNCYKEGLKSYVTNEVNNNRLSEQKQEIDHSTL